MSQEIDKLFDLFRPHPFGQDPNRVPQEEHYVGQMEPTNWYGGHSYSSFLGVKNLLEEPTMEDVPSSGVIGTAKTDASLEWSAWYVLNSGAFTTETVEWFREWARTDAQLAAFNSDEMGVSVESSVPANAWDATLYWLADDPVSKDSQGGHPWKYVVGAFTIRNDELAGHWANFSKAQVRVQLVSDTTQTAVVLAESAPLNMQDLAPGEMRQLAAILSYSVWSGSVTLRLRFDVAKTAGQGSGQSARVNFGEPILSMTYAPEPPPFTPSVSAWLPTRVQHLNAASNHLMLDARLNGEAVSRFRIAADGDLSWGSGNGLDTTLARHSAARLHVSERILSWNETWQTPSLLNGWVHYGAPFTTPRYRRDATGRVHIKGLLKSGAVPGAIFTLPTGYRPLEQHIFVVTAHNGTTYVEGRVDAQTNGNVYVQAGGSNFLSLDGINFLAEQ